MLIQFSLYLFKYLSKLILITKSLVTPIITRLAKDNSGNSTLLYGFYNAAILLE